MFALQCWKLDKWVWFSLLDEQCLIPKGNDEKLANKLYETLEKHESFTVSKLQKAKRQFVIHHYAGDVCYSTGWLLVDKNKDHMHPESRHAHDDIVVKICAINI
ncbi:hypothetical protein PINS_up002595 [Pythium insidiosum]|nr:hypothetical protein PINS_up002595 [Pythium insidiosum]